jgi:hypothetical protein
MEASILLLLRSGSEVIEPGPLLRLGEEKRWERSA